MTMEQEMAGGETIRSGSKPQSDGRLVPEHTGIPGQTAASGVSDQRRIQLEHLEAEAGTQHEAADESVPQRRQSDPASGLSTPSRINPNGGSDADTDKL